MMNIKELKEMIALMQENGLTELEIEKNGFKIRLKKSTSGIEVKREGAYVEGQASLASLEQDKTLAIETQLLKESDDMVIVRSPMVGTFYTTPAPDKEPYVIKGKTVKDGDVLCIIEAMKLMNEIKSEASGCIVDILANNGQPVEFDQPLFKIQKT